LTNIQLQDLLPRCEFPSELGMTSVRDLTLDSRKVKEGSVFVALKGAYLNRSQFIDSAFDLGAVAVLIELDKGNKAVASLDNQNRLIVALPNLRASLGQIAARFFSEPSSELVLVGITGTNGKTSCADLLVQLWRASGITAASIGTLGVSYEAGTYQHTGLTTLDVIENQRVLRELVDKGVTHVAMEVSSHGIDQRRIDGLTFSATVLTNISRDHLDYHGTMKRYAETKLSFLESNSCVSVINIDNVGVKRWLNSGNIASLLTFGRNAEAVVRIVSEEYKADGIDVELDSPWGDFALKLSLVGQHNLYNFVAVFSIIGSLDSNLMGSGISAAAENIHAPPGRLELIRGLKTVYVDYAHTPDALENILSALSAHCKNKLILVFGCGGDRDQGKRPLMAKVAEKYANVVFLTTDNPRSESPQNIIDQVISGFGKPDEVRIVLDRASAIKSAVELAGNDDVVLIAGKGHENYQEIKGVKHPFSDADEVRRLIA